MYSTAGGQTVAKGGSEPPVAQPVSQLATIARTVSRSLQHPELDINGFLRAFVAFGEAVSFARRTAKAQTGTEAR